MADGILRLRYVKQPGEGRCKIYYAHARELLSGTDPGAVQNHNGLHGTLLWIGTVIAVRFRFDDHRPGPDARIEIVTRCKINIQVATQWAANSHFQHIGFGIIYRGDDRPLAIAYGVEQFAGFAYHLGTLLLGHNAVLPISGVDQEIAIVDRRIEHFGF